MSRTRWIVVCLAPLAAACGVSSGGSADASDAAASSPAPAGGGGASPSPAPPDGADASSPSPSGLDASAPSPADAAPACPASAAWPAGFEGTISLTHGGVARTYVAHVGKSVAAGTAAPLLVNVHGLDNSPQIQEAFSGMNAIADAKGFVVVYPQGINASFNAGSCCGYAAQNGVDDLGFVRALVADAESKICVDPRRVYATGFSNGGFLSHTLGCEASDLFAAIAPVSGAIAAPSCAPSRAVPVIAFHGDADPIVAYANGKAAITDWVQRDGCTGDATRTAFGSSYCDEWATCRDGVKIRFCTIAGGSHLWPGAGAAIPASPMIWDFLTSFTLPSAP